MSFTCMYSGGTYSMLRKHDLDMKSTFLMKHLLKHVTLQLFFTLQVVFMQLACTASIQSVNMYYTKVSTIVAISVYSSYI